MCVEMIVVTDSRRYFPMNYNLNLRYPQLDVPNELSYLGLFSSSKDCERSKQIQQMSRNVSPGIRLLSGGR